MVKKTKSIRSQIFHGYVLTVAIMAILVVVMAVCLVMINRDYHIISDNRSNQGSTQEAVTAHYSWLDQLNVSIQTGAEFTGSLDPTQCSLGKWLSTVSEDNLDGQINTALEEIKVPHERIHKDASDLIALSKKDKDAAYLQYTKEIKPQVHDVIAGLTTVSGRYKEIADEASIQLQRMITISLISSVTLAVVAVAIALMYANSISRKISKPIAAVAKWSHNLSLGQDDVNFDLQDIDEHSGDEIGEMITSFKKMADSIGDNVNVVRKVAEGDMTAFVNIRSSGDSLGKNLYKMVQSNDLMFNEILQIAQTVASGSEQIAKASQSLADSSLNQAESIHSLSVTIDHANDLIEHNAEKTRAAETISSAIRESAQQSNEKLNALLCSVREIRESSSKISTVIKSIDDIAFQTNILALNAAIEAARAGEAGKGFAVVANEVRQLALKSANAVKDSRILIDDTISKTNQGNRISEEAADMFKQIIDQIEEIVHMIYDIASASDEQMMGIGQVRNEIEQISQAASSNAAISEESAASSEEMNGNADLLKGAMGKFRLRQRQYGHAYIPEEKRNDEEFIKRANENYRKSLETGRYGFELEGLPDE